MSNSTQELIDKISQKKREQEAMIEQELQKNLMSLMQRIDQGFSAVNDLIDKNTDGLELKLQKFKFKPWIYPLIALLLGSLLLLPTIHAGEKLWDLIIVSKTSQAETLEKTLEEHNKALRALGTAGIQHTVRDGRLYLLLQKGAKEPKPWKNIHGRWVIDLGE